VSRPRALGTRGFTLIELIVVIAILSIMAGAVLPVASRVVDRAARKNTRAELVALADATLEYARDTLRLPAQIADLERRPSRGLSGWSGPYLARSMTDARNGAPGWEVDGWSRPYVVEPFEHGVRYLSLGRDGVRDEVGASDGSGGDPGDGPGDDIVVALDIRPVLREQTLATVAIVNRALDAFHGSARAEPLPADVRGALRALVREGLLPEAERFSRDAWGQALVADPPDRVPLVRVWSSALGADVPGPVPVRGTGEATGRETENRGPAVIEPSMPKGRSRERQSEAWRRLEQRARRGG